MKSLVFSSKKLTFEILPPLKHLNQKIQNIDQAQFEFESLRCNKKRLTTRESLFDLGLQNISGYCLRIDFFLFYHYTH